MNEYLSFAPPDHLAAINRRDWSKQEADQYREWLLSVLDSRVGNLVNYLEEPFGPEPSDHLMALGSKAATLLVEYPFSEGASGEKRLTDNGYSLAADLGLLTARYLLQAKPDSLRWETFRKHKREIAYNLPVLSGLSFNYLEPIGGSIAEAQGILRGQRSGDIWSKMYDFWSSKE